VGEGVVGGGEGGVRVGDPPPGGRLAPRLHHQALQPLLRPPGALALERLAENAVGREEIVALQRGRLVLHLVGRWHVRRVADPLPEARRAPGSCPSSFMHDCPRLARCDGRSVEAPACTSSPSASTSPTRCSRTCASALPARASPTRSPTRAGRTGRTW